MVNHARFACRFCLVVASIVVTATHAAADETVGASSVERIKELLRYLPQSPVLGYVDLKRWKESTFVKEGLSDLAEIFDEDDVALYNSVDAAVFGFPYLAKEVDLKHVVIVVQGRFEEWGLNEGTTLEIVKGKRLLSGKVPAQVIPFFNAEFDEIYIGESGNDTLILGFSKETVKRVLQRGPEKMTDEMAAFARVAVPKYTAAVKGWGSAYLKSPIPEFDESDFNYVSFGIDANEHLELAFTLSGNSVQDAVMCERNVRSFYEQYLTLMRGLLVNRMILLEPLETCEITRDKANVRIKCRVSRVIAQAILEEGYVIYLDGDGKEVKNRHDAKWIKVGKPILGGRSLKLMGFRYFFDKNGDASTNPYGIVREIDTGFVTRCFDKDDNEIDTVLVIRPGESGSPAEKIGLRPGDVLRRCNGEWITFLAHHQFWAAAPQSRGENWKLEVIRNGQPIELTVKAEEFADVLLRQVENARAEYTGARIEFHITKVTAGSIAEELGMQPGDIILNYNGEECCGRLWFISKRLEEKDPNGVERQLLVRRGGEHIRFRIPPKVPLGIHTWNVVSPR